jgi:hypothetical protein
MTPLRQKSDAPSRAEGLTLGNPEAKIFDPKGLS